MDIWKIIIWVLTATDVLIALLLIALILVQQSKESGFGSAFGGVGESVFGAHTGSHLVRMTIIFSTMFLVITLLLAALVGHRSTPKSVVETETPAAESSAVEKKAPQTSPAPAPSGESKAAPEKVPEAPAPQPSAENPK